ncbi:uroporphyrinogen-III synthase [Brachybacterium sp. AOP43-C2-M15]|uniref:uroporphyrinogen-III synthase n=1 Tax=Brachybacterium sp. AOP43-C2-M15 TaxID=3457661 RepID=UPI004033B2F2
MPPTRPAPRPVLVTRPAGRGAALMTLLAEAGITAEHQPLTRLVAAEGEELDTARELLAGGTYTHLVVTSRTAATSLGAVPVPAACTVVAVGGGTAQTLAEHGIDSSWIADGSGAALVAQMPQAAPEEVVLFPASAAASRTVPEGLRAKGYRVHEVTAYRPERLEPPPAVTVGLATGGYGALVVTSPMIARRAAALGIHASTPIVTIGEPTSAAVREAGLAVGRQAHEPTDAALLAAVREVLAATAASGAPAAPGAPGASTPAPTSTDPLTVPDPPTSKEPR